MLKLLLLLGLALQVSEPTAPVAKIECAAGNPDGKWQIVIHQQKSDGTQRPLVQEGPFKSRDKAVKRCSQIVGQWENLYNPKAKGKSK